MPQAVEVIGEPEEQGLADLHGPAAAGGVGRLFSFHPREDGCDLGSLCVLFLRKSPVPLITNSPSGEAAARFGGKDATGSPVLPDIFMISLGIELGISQHLAPRQPLPGGVDESRPCSPIAPRSWPRVLRQQNRLLPIRYHQPLPPVPMTGPTARMLFATAYEKGADGVVGKPRAIHSGRNAHVLFPAAPLPHRLSYPARDGVVVQSPQEAVQSRVVRHAPQWQDLAQLAVLAETHLGFAKSPVRIAHQAENGQQLRLGEWVFAETTALGRQNTPGYAGKGQESDFWHPTSCSIRKHSLPRFVDLPKIYLYRGRQQSHLKSCVLKMRILRKLQAHFSKVRIPKKLVTGVW